MINNFFNKILMTSFFIMLLSCGAQNYKAPTDLKEAKSLAPDSDMTDDGVLPPKWEHTRQWNLEEEDRYSRWIEINYTKDFYLKRNIWVDCADAETVRRAWYAVKRGLPYAYRPIYDMTKIVSSYDYKDRPPMDFISDLRNAVSTKNLPLNSYKVRIDKNDVSNLKPGIFNLYHGQHTQPVVQVDKKTGLLLLRQSTGVTVPIMLMDSYYFITVPKDDVTIRRQFTPVVKEKGFIALELLKPEFEQIGPYAGGEIDFNKQPFFEWLQAIILNIDLSEIKKIRKNTLEIFANDILENAQNRVRVVEEGYKICRNYSGSDLLLCTDKPEGAHSTPERDARLRDLYYNYGSYLYTIRTLSQDAETALFGEKLLQDKSFVVTPIFERDDGSTGIAYSLSLTLVELQRRITGGFTTPDPKHTIQERWGEAILNIYSPEPEKDYWELVKYGESLNDEKKLFVYRNDKIRVMNEVCLIPGYDPLCKLHVNQATLDDFQMARGITQYLAAKPMVSNDLKLDLSVQKVVSPGWPYEGLIAKEYAKKIGASEYLENIVKKYHVYSQGYMNSSNSETVVVGNRPIDPEFVAQSTSPYSYQQWYFLRAHLIQKLLKIDPLTALPSSLYRPDDTTTTTEDNHLTVLVYNLFDFYTAFNESKVEISLDATPEELWGGKPIEIIFPLP